ncbi:unnamed protein product [Brachionus calyciflorus]|uniref:Transmembrane protein n=1 Tax=Brachionus calyciflorus TaxID=104777 RepID=A0A814J0A8_9BILA|nr:unnamed protein product [Brachionus calyciflorus]
MSNKSNIVQTNVEESNDDYSYSENYNVKQEENRFLSKSRQNLDSTQIKEDIENVEENNFEETEPRQSKLKSFFKKSNKPKFENKSFEFEKTKKPLDSEKKKQPPKEVFHFQTKIRNTGFWGKVRLRKGSWLVIIGLLLMSVGLTVIAVFWRWWYGPGVNVPCRTVGITLLILGFFAFIFGLISNLMMIQDPLSKHFVGAPPRAASWILLASIFGMTIAADLMIIYYTYWHNRFVNNPMIAISIILFFFSPIAFVWSLVHNFNQMNIIRANHDPEYAKKYKKKSSKEEFLIEKEQVEDPNETIDEGIKNEADLQVFYESSTLKKDFRKKNIKLQPRTVLPSHSSAILPNESMSK